jgi:hypothetical protein
MLEDSRRPRTILVLLLAAGFELVYAYQDQRFDFGRPLKAPHSPRGTGDEQVRPFFYPQRASFTRPSKGFVYTVLRWDAHDPI